MREDARETTAPATQEPALNIGRLPEREGISLRDRIRGAGGSAFHNRGITNAYDVTASLELRRSPRPV